MFEQDFIMRLIHEILRALLKFIFNIDEKQENEVEFSYAETSQKYEELLALVDEGKINEAENRLYDKLDTNNIDGLELALLFYRYINGFSDSFLEDSAFSREEIREGISAVTIMYGYGGFTDVFL